MKFIFNGEIIRQAREKKGLKQHDLAKLADIQQANISRWEHSLNEPTATQLARLMYYLKININDLFVIKK